VEVLIISGFLSLSWVLSFYKGWWGFIKDHPKTKKEKKKRKGKEKKVKLGKVLIRLKVSCKMN
jgi:hypothetical protein